MAAQKPIAKFRAGQVSCALWENDMQVNGNTKTVLKASVQRRYKDSQGNWKSSQSLGRNEIPLAIYCLEKAFDKIIQEETAESGSNGVEEEVIM
jgi:hypothetical protein